MTDSENLLSVEETEITDNENSITDDSEYEFISDPIPVTDEIKEVINSAEPEILPDDASLEDVVNILDYTDDDSDEESDVLFVKSHKDEEEFVFSIQESDDDSETAPEIPEDASEDASNSDEPDSDDQVMPSDEIIHDVSDDTESVNPPQPVVNEKRCLTSPNYIAPDLQNGISDIADAVCMFASGVNKKCCRILISSPARSTGKTTLALMLALELSREYKVLLADCDFYKPKLHKYFNCMNRFGVLNAYLGEVELNNVILNSDNDNLKFITSGKGLKLKDIKGKGIASMLDAVSESFDFVIFDSASVFKARYVSGIASSVDGSLLVIKKGSTEYADFDKCLDRLDMVGSDVLGVVINS